MAERRVSGVDSCQRHTGADRARMGQAPHRARGVPPHPQDSAARPLLPIEQTDRARSRRRSRPARSWVGGRADARCSRSRGSRSRCCYGRAGRSTAALDRVRQSGARLESAARRSVRARVPVRHAASAFRARARRARRSTLALATVMSLVGPVSMSQASKIVADEFARRNAEIDDDAQRRRSRRIRRTGRISRRRCRSSPSCPRETEKELHGRSRRGGMRCSLRCWRSSHSPRSRSPGRRTIACGRARLGAPLRPLREFRFNDQLVWGLIVGLTIMLLPTLESLARRRQESPRLFRRALRRCAVSAC